MRSNRGPRDRSRVEMSEDWELAYWSEKFGVEKNDLKYAVERVGPMVTDVEAFFDSTLNIRAITGLPNKDDSSNNRH